MYSHIKEKYIRRKKCFYIHIWGNLCIVAALSELSDASIGEMTSPRFSQPLRDFSIQSGHRVCLQCRITGHPIPEAKWYKDNKPIDNSPDYEVRLSLYLQLINPKLHKVVTCIFLTS